MGGIVFYASLDNPQLEQIEIELSGVEVIDVNSIENRAKLQTTFMVKNPSEKTFTVAIIAYELFVGDKSIGTGQYSTADIAMPGRAAFYPDAEIPLKNIFQLILTEENASEYQSIIEGESVQYRVEGIVTVETAWALVEKEFENTLG